MKKEEGLIAVIVGIDGYKKKPLHCAVNDAVCLTETLQKVWKGRKVHIKTLVWPSLNEKQAKSQRETWGIKLPKNANKVTRDGILSTIQECASLAGESDTFIFYFSGHGVLADEEPALVTVADGKTAEGIEYIKIKEIQQVAAECVSQKKVMILDCCQSPANKHKPVEGYKNLKDLIQGWSIFISSSPGEVSLEDQYFGDSRDDYLQQGIFTASLVEGLRGEAAGSSGSVSLADLAYFVGKRVPVEYQERVLTMIYLLSKNGVKDQTDIKGMGFNSQNPVLLSEAVAIGGPYQVIMAPEPEPLYSEIAGRILPTKNFLKYWLKFLLGKWHIEFPYKFEFREIGALLYAATMLLTVIWHCSEAMNHTFLVFTIVIGLGSALLWWVMLPFAVAANESYWTLGGYATVIFYLLWHIIVLLGLAWLWSVDKNISQVGDKVFFVGLELFCIFAAVAICCCNASQAIIALAEIVRTDERREIRRAIRAFQHFKYKIFVLDLNSYVAQVPARPEFYLFILAAAILIAAVVTLPQISTETVETVEFRLYVIRNIAALFLVVWLVFWYLGAFDAIKGKVYKV
ncbi:MAG: caspase family protein [Candidatus Aminicenantes bacterium]|nr:MAG: caspase family protein [Candidatus Aminicenantes bacterium]